MNIFKHNNNTLYLGNYKNLDFNGEKIDLIVTSPPYNIGSSGNAKIGGRKIGGYDAKNFRSIQDYKDNLPELEYQETQKDFLRWGMSNLKVGGCIAYNVKNRHKNGRIISPTEWLIPLCNEGVLEIQEQITWDRGSTHNHEKSFLYPIDELIFILKHTGSKISHFKNQDFPGGKNKGCSSVWRIPRDCKNKHNAAFPLSFAEQLIRLYSNEGDLVCDPYSGSGTTMLASHNLDRKFIGSELMRKHFNMTKKRLLEL